MSLLDRLLLRRTARALAVVWPALAAAVVASQALRLGHRFAGAGAPGEVASLLALALVPAALAVAPLAAAAAVLWTLGALEASGERDALTAAGASPARLAAAPVAVAVVAGLLAQALLLATPAAVDALGARASTLIARATLARLRPDVLAAPAPGLAAARAGRGVAIVDERRAAVLTSSDVRATDDAFTLRDAILRSPRAPALPVGDVDIAFGGTELAFVARAASPVLPPSVPALALVGCAVAARTSLRRPRARALAWAVVAVAHVLLARAAPWLPAAAAAAALLALSRAP